MTEAQSATATAQEKLISDIKAVIADAEELLGATADQGSEKMTALRARIGQRLSDARARLSAAEAALLDKTRAAAQATDAFVHESPWQAVGIGAGVGFLLGLILGRR